jgi:hypothetical protein
MVFGPPVDAISLGKTSLIRLATRREPVKYMGDSAQQALSSLRCSSTVQEQ